MAATSESNMRAAMVTYFPMFIATLSLLASIYNGYLNGKFVDLIQHNLGRAEYMRTCKEIIDAYFQAKLRVHTLQAGGAAAEQREAANAVAKFAALGTYLANLRDETIRARYTELSREIEKLAGEARRMPAEELARRLEASDRLFGEMNDDCVRSAKTFPF